MKLLSLKFYNDDLHYRLKVQAAKEKKTLQDLIIEIIKVYLEKVEKQKNEAEDG